MSDYGVTDDFCPIGTPVDGKYVCLGKGYLCPGGTYKSGLGNKAKCYYDHNPSDLVIFLFLIVVTIIFTKMKEVMEHSVPKTYKSVVQAIVAELAALGFVSLVAFMIKFAWDGEASPMDRLGADLALGSTLKDSLHELHFLLFGLSLSFITFCCYFLADAIRRLKRFQQYQKYITEIVEKHKGLPQIGAHIPNLSWFARVTEKDRQEIFMRIHDRFTDTDNAVQGDLYIHIPRSFDLAKYLTVASAHIMAEIVEIHPIDWCVVTVFVTIAWSAWYFTLDNASGTDGGYIAFWIIEIVFILTGIALDFKVHHIFTQLVPAVENDVEDWHNRSRGSDDLPRDSRSLSLTDWGGPERLRRDEAEAPAGIREERRISIEEVVEASGKGRRSSIGDMFKKKEPNRELDPGELRRAAYLTATGRTELLSPRPSKKVAIQHSMSAEMQRRESEEQAAGMEWESQQRRSAPKQNGHADPSKSFWAGKPVEDSEASNLLERTGSPVTVRSASPNPEQLEDRQHDPEFRHAAGELAPESLSIAGSWDPSTLDKQRPVQAVEMSSSSPVHRSIVPMPLQAVDVNNSSPVPASIQQYDEIAVSVAGSNFGTSERNSQDSSRQLLNEGGLHRNGSMDNLSNAPSSLQIPERTHGQDYSVYRRQDSDVEGRVVQGDDDLQVKVTRENVQHRRRRYVPPYVKLSNERLLDRNWFQKKIGGQVINHHQHLFWFEAKGPKVLLHLIKHQALGSCVLIVISVVMYREKMLCTGSDNCESYTASGVVLLLVSMLLPLLGAAFLSNTLCNYTVACNIEYMKSAELIKEVLAKARAKRTLKLFGALLTLASLIDGIKMLKEEIQKAVNEDEATARVVASVEIKRQDTDSFLSRQVRQSIDMAARSFQPNKRRSQELERISTDNPSNLARTMNTLSRGNSLDNPRRPFFKPKHEASSKGFKVLNQEVVKQWQDLFEEADVSKTGTLSRIEFKNLLMATGTVADDDRTVDTLFHIMDTDGLGVVTMESFMNVMARERTRKLDGDELAETIWGLFDSRHTGIINISEFQTKLKRLRPRYDAESAVQVMHDIDIDRRGWITRGEFTLFVNRIVETVTYG